MERRRNFNPHLSARKEGSPELQPRGAAQGNTSRVAPFPISNHGWVPPSTRGRRVEQSAPDVNLTRRRIQGYCLIPTYFLKSRFNIFYYSCNDMMLRHKQIFGYLTFINGLISSSDYDLDMF